MAPLPLFNEGDLSLVVRYSLESGEEMSEAVVGAFQAAGVDVYDRPTQLVDWIEADIFEQVSWTSDQPIYVSTRIWDRQVVMTPEEVRIYEEACGTL